MRERGTRKKRGPEGGVKVKDISPTLTGLDWARRLNGEVLKMRLNRSKRRARSGGQGPKMGSFFVTVSYVMRINRCG